MLDDSIYIMYQMVKLTHGEEGAGYTGGMWSQCLEGDMKGSLGAGHIPFCDLSADFMGVFSL